MDHHQCEKFSARKEKTYKFYVSNKYDNQSFSKFQWLQDPLKLKNQNRFTSPDSLKKLTDPSTTQKIYWSILKIFINKKIPCITQIFHRNQFIWDFKQKADIFIHFLATQCTPVGSTSKLQSIFESWTFQPLLTVNFTTNDIEKFMKNLDPNKDHGYD